MAKMPDAAPKQHTLHLTRRRQYPILNLLLSHNHRGIQHSAKLLCTT
jgi:hypothetical protein